MAAEAMAKAMCIAPAPSWRWKQEQRLVVYNQRILGSGGRTTTWSESEQLLSHGQNEALLH